MNNPIELTVASIGDVRLINGRRGNTKNTVFKTWKQGTKKVLILERTDKPGHRRAVMQTVESAISVPTPETEPTPYVLKENGTGRRLKGAYVAVGQADYTADGLKTIIKDHGRVSMAFAVAR
jgi:hypothetical protein